LSNTKYIASALSALRGKLQ